MIEIPEFPVLHGQDAIDALNEIIEELKEQKGKKELTAKQAKALIKFANGMILSIQAEISSEALAKKRLKHATFLKRFEEALFPKSQLLK